MRSAGVVTAVAAGREKWLLSYDELKARRLVPASLARASQGRAARMIMKKRFKNNTAPARMNNWMPS